MGLRRISLPFPKPAPDVFWAVLCAVISLGLSACNKKGGTPDWDTPGSKPSVPAEHASDTSKSGAAQQSRPNPLAAYPPQTGDATPETQPDPDTDAKPGCLRFITYNVENWLTMDRSIDNKLLRSRPKPESEKNAVIRILISNNPDVVGLCEIGQASDLAEIQQTLKAAGLNLPHSQYTGGTDAVRHLGLLSRYPITSTAKPAATEYQMNGRTFGINRGILDVTIPARGKSYRFIGVHLKSKREVDDGDQNEMRIHEAHLLRRHLDAIFQTEPAARLIVYGDFNDTYPSKAVRAITASPDPLQRMIPIYFKDSHGEAWTHHWKNQDIYARIDFVCVSNIMKPDVNYRACHIIDDPLCDQASDHRPLLAAFR